MFYLAEHSLIVAKSETRGWFRLKERMKHKNLCFSLITVSILLIVCRNTECNAWASFTHRVLFTEDDKHRVKFTLDDHITICTA